MKLFVFLPLTLNVFSYLCLITVLAKYPSDQNSPPHSRVLTRGHRRNTSRAVMLLITCTIFFTEYIGTD
jgi:hypothetical protein